MRSLRPRKTTSSARFDISHDLKNAVDGDGGYAQAFETMRRPEKPDISEGNEGKTDEASQLIDSLFLTPNEPPWYSPQLVRMDAGSGSSHCGGNASDYRSAPAALTRNP
ncbi:MAG: hypothetical protein ACLTMP_02710 [Eggerthella lenta]